MDVKTRQELITETLLSRGEVSLADLSTETGVSEMTIRRDLEALEAEGFLRRVRGGAVSLVSGSYEPPYAVRERLHIEEKRRIGRLAATQVRDGDTVVVDAGSTALEVARNLGDRRELTVFTVSLRVADLLADRPNIRLIVSGGEPNRGERVGDRMMIGPLAVRALSELSFDLLFLNVGSVDLRGGLRDFNPFDVEVKRVALQNSRRRIAVADSTKLGKVAFAEIASLSAIDVLVTDSGADPATVREIRALGVETLLA